MFLGNRTTPATAFCHGEHALHLSVPHYGRQCAQCREASAY